MDKCGPHIMVQYTHNPYLECQMLNNLGPHVGQVWQLFCLCLAQMCGGDVAHMTHNWNATYLPVWAISVSHVHY